MFAFIRNKIFEHQYRLIKYRKFRKLNHLRRRIFKLYDGRLQITLESITFNSISLKVSYKRSNDDSFNEKITNLINIFKENNMLQNDNIYKDLINVYSPNKKEDIDLHKHFDDLIALMQLDKYVEKPCFGYTIGEFEFDDAENYVWFKIHYGQYKVKLSRSDNLYHTTFSEFNELKPHFISQESPIYSSKRIYVSLNMITDRYGSDVDIDNREELNAFMNENKGINIYKFSPSDYGVKYLYLDPELITIGKNSYGLKSACRIGYIETENEIPINKYSVTK